MGTFKADLNLFYVRKIIYLAFFQLIFFSISETPIMYMLDLLCYIFFYFYCFSLPPHLTFVIAILSFLLFIYNLSTADFSLLFSNNLGSGPFCFFFEGFK